MPNLAGGEYSRTWPEGETYFIPLLQGLLKYKNDRSDYEKRFLDQLSMGWKVKRDFFQIDFLNFSKIS